jgi:hypothetical protein
MTEPAAHVARTADGRFRIYVRNQTSELCPHDRRLTRRPAADPTQPPPVEQFAAVDNFGNAPLRSDACGAPIRA